MNNWSNFEFLRLVGRILADRGPDWRAEDADIIEVEGRWIVWPDSAQNAGDTDIRVYDSWAEFEDAEIDTYHAWDVAGDEVQS